ncbi:CAP domain-containing protein [Uliginosibacterium sp. 31-12]|uniref:CAP domain-containing protein n=1 Tax=Uliginosibacterium sp. 31-12 TaxID=3062781 RepID=UPI0026E2010E|nr:CAP domain-containing protein [Uliginosibacterium sp. 31-12]MDO6388250.1 CAP domain-containing protein [Uliginosibacterium sp. 31-12]
MHRPTRPPYTLLPCVLFVLSLGACGGGGGGDSSTTSGQTGSGTSSAASASQTSSARSASSTSSSGNANSSSAGSSSSSSGLYQSAPLVSSCIAGQLQASEKNSVLTRLNEIRARHGLPAVSYDSSGDAAAAAAALYMVANETLTHTPSSSGKCYSEDAYRLANTSNLYTSWGYSTVTTPSADAMVSYLIDSGVSSLGHRRWLLYPFFAATSFGRVDSAPAGGTGRMASALRTIGGEASSVSMSNDFVAYPYGSYPASEFSTSWFLSFSAIASKTNRANNGGSQVSFAGATITVTDGNGQSLGITEQSANYEGYGLPNHLQWKVVGLANGGSYTVRIAGVNVNGTSRDYQYAFQLR